MITSYVTLLMLALKNPIYDKICIFKFIIYKSFNQMLQKQLVIIKEFFQNLKYEHLSYNNLEIRNYLQILGY